MLVSPEVADVTAGEARWRIAAFPLLAGLLTVTLIPAVRRGSAAVTDNGTPWRWPWFPWTVFVVLGAAVCFRSFSLAISFDLANAHSAYWDTSFGVYLLLPFLLAVLFVLFEIGIVERLQKLQDGVLVVAPVLLIVAYPWIGPWTRQFTYQRFAYEVVQTLGSPVLYALGGLLLLYGSAWMRGHRRLGFLSSLLAAMFVEPHAFGARTYELSFETLQIWPLVTLGLLELAVGIRSRRSRPALVGAMSLALAGRLWLADLELPAVNNELAELVRLKSTITYHLILASVLIIGSMFRDTFARRLRLIGAPALTATCLAAIATGVEHGIALAVLLGYGAAMTAITLICWRLMSSRLYLIAALFNVACGVLALSRLGYRSVEHVMLLSGVKPLFWAILCFATGVLISILKSGLGERLLSRCSVDSDHLKVSLDTDEIEHGVSSDS